MSRRFRDGVVNTVDDRRAVDEGTDDAYSLVGNRAWPEAGWKKGKDGKREGVEYAWAGILGIVSGRQTCHRGQYSYARHPMRSRS